MPRFSFESLNIDSFRGLRRLQLDGLGQFNILLGGNNSGKTSVLEALSLMCNPLEPFEWLAMVHRRDFGRLDETRIQSLRWCFPQAGQLSDPEAMFEGECRLACGGMFPLRSLRATYRHIIGEPVPTQKQRGARRRPPVEDEVGVFEVRRGAELAHFVEMDPAVREPNLFESQRPGGVEPIVVQVWEDEPFMRRPFRRKQHVRNETLTPYSYQINRLQVQYKSKHMFERGPDMVLDLVREFDPDVEAIEIGSVRGGRPALYLNHRKLGPAPLSIFGDALRRAVLLASTLPTLQNGGMLFIDEIETGIHISLLQRIFAWLHEAAKACRVQVVATTHSLEAIDALLASSDPAVQDVVTFHLEQTPEKTVAKRYGEDLLARLRKERGLDVR